MRRITVVALVAVLASLGAACGGDDDDASTEDTEATDDGGTTDDGGDDGASTDGDLAAALEGVGGCTGAAAAVSASLLAGFNPQAAEQLEENRAFFDDFADSVPDDIKEDVERLAAYVDAYSDVLSDYTPADFADPEKAAKLSEDVEALEDDYPSDEIQDANDNISDWFTNECPALAGE